MQQVSVLPSTAGTRGLLDGDALAACEPRRPALINVGRGDLISEEVGGQIGSRRRWWSDVSELGACPRVLGL